MLLQNIPKYIITFLNFQWIQITYVQYTFVISVYNYFKNFNHNHRHNIKHITKIQLQISNGSRYSAEVADNDVSSSSIDSDAVRQPKRRKVKSTQSSHAVGIRGTVTTIDALDNLREEVDSILSLIGGKILKVVKKHKFLIESRAGVIVLKEPDVRDAKEKHYDFSLYPLLHADKEWTSTLQVGLANSISPMKTATFHGLVEIILQVSHLFQKCYQQNFELLKSHF